MLNLKHYIIPSGFNFLPFYQLIIIYISAFAYLTSFFFYKTLSKIIRVFFCLISKVDIKPKPKMDILNI